MWDRLPPGLRDFLHGLALGQPATEKTEKGARDLVRYLRRFRRYGPPIVGVGSAVELAIGLPFYDVSIPLAAAVGLGAGAAAYVYLWLLLWVMERWFVMEMRVLGARLDEFPQPGRTAWTVYWVSWLVLGGYVMYVNMAGGNYLLGAWGIVLAALIGVWLVTFLAFRWIAWRARRRQDS